jgi:hypothetical protein
LSFYKNNRKLLAVLLSLHNNTKESTLAVCSLLAAIQQPFSSHLTAKATLGFFEK